MKYMIRIKFRMLNMKIRYKVLNILQMRDQSCTNHSKSYQFLKQEENTNKLKAMHEKCELILNGRLTPDILKY